MTRPNRVEGQDVADAHRLPSGYIEAPERFIQYDGQAIVRTRYSTHQMFTKAGNTMYGGRGEPAILGETYCTGESEDLDPANDHIEGHQFSVYYVEDEEAVLYEVTDR